MAEELFHGGGGGGGAAKVSLNGNTSGTLTLISTGTLYLGGGANITLSQDGNSITISGGVNTGATTFLAGVQNLGNTSGATGTVNNQIIFAGGNNITLSESKNANSATVTISGPNVFSAGVSTGGNTLGTTGTVTNQVLFVGGNNITLSQSSAAGGATITISGPTLGAAQTGISSVSVSDTVYTSGGISFVGSNAATVKSGAGQQVIIDVPVQSAQPEGTVAFGVSSGGNTLGTTGLATGTGPRLVFVGGNNITLSQSLDAGGSSGTITISGANIGGAQTGISSVSVSDTVYTSGGISFVGSNNVTVKSGPGQQIIIDATGGGGAFTGGVSSGGNTAGTTGTVSNGILFVGGNNVTLQQSSGAGGATVTISQNQATGFVNSISVVGNTAGDVTAGTGRLILAGGNNVTLSGATAAGAMTITVSGANVGGAQTGISSISVSDTVYTSGQVKFTGSNIVTVKSGTGQAVIIDASVPAQSAESQSLGMSNLGNTSGTTGVASGAQVRYVFAGGNNITLSQSLNGASGTITISAPSGGGAGASNLGNTAGSTGTVDYQLVFVGSDNITLSQSTNGSSGTISIIGGGAFKAGVSSGGNTQGDTKTVGSQVVFAGGNNITLSQATNGGSATITIIGASGGGAGYTAGVSSLGNTSGSTGPTTAQMVLAGGNNITLSQSVNGGSATVTISGPSGGGAGMGTGANTSGTSGTVGRELFFYGGSNISLSQSVNGSSASLSIIGASGGTGAGYTAGLSNIGNTSGDATNVTGQLILAGGNNVTLSGSTNAGSMTITISAGASGAAGVQVTLDGNTSGTLAAISSGTLTLAGGNNITLSQVGNAVTISGANVGGAQTGISSISVSDTVYTSGQVKFTGSNNITVLSGTGQQVIISGPTGGGAGMGSQGNTAGTSGTVGRELYFVGGSNISLSQSVNGASATLTINGATAGGGQTGISSISVSDTVYTSGQVKFTGSNMVTVKSGTGQAVIIDATQSVQPLGTVGIGVTGATNGGFAVGTLGLASGTGPLYYIRIGSNLQASQSLDAASQSGTVTLQAVAAIESIGIWNLGNTSGTSGQVTGSAIGYWFAGGNNITMSQSLDTVNSRGTVTISAFNQSVQPEGQDTIGMSNLGNTAGTTGVVNGSNLQYYFAGGNNITLSQSINGSSATLTISGPNVGGAQTGISSVSVSDTVYTSGQIVITGAGAVTVSSGANQSVIINAPVQSNQNVVFYATSNTISSSQGTINASSIILRGNDRLSVGVSGGSLIFEAGGADAHTNVIGMSSDGGNTSGTNGVISANNWRYAFAGGNNITLSQSLNGSSATLTISAAAQTVQTQGMVSINGSTGAMSFNAGNLMSLSTNGSSLTFINVLSSSGIAQNVSNVSSAGTQTSRYALADHAHVGVAGLNVSGTATTWVGNVMFSGTNITFVTGGNSSAGSIGLSVAAPGGGGGAAVGMGATGNTAGNTFSSTSGTVYIQGTNNITVSGSTAAGSLNTIWVSGPTGGGAGMGTGTNTSGTSGTVGKELYFYGNSNVTLSQSTNGSSGSLTIVVGAGGGNQTIGMSNVGNTSGDTTPVSGAAVRVVFAGGNNVTLSQSTNGSSATVTISAAQASGATVSEWMPPGVGYSSFTQQGQSSLVLFPVAPPYYVTATQANLWASISVSTSSNSSHDGRISLHVGIFTKNASTLSLASSGSVSHSWNVTGSTSSGSVNGWRMLTVPINVNMSPGQYWVGVISATATTNANWFTASNMALIPVAAAYSGALGATNNTNQMFLGQGVWSAQSAAMPASVAFSHITATSASTARPLINFVNLTV